MRVATHMIRAGVRRKHSCHGPWPSLAGWPRALRRGPHRLADWQAGRGSRRVRHWHGHWQRQLQLTGPVS